MASLSSSVFMLELEALGLSFRSCFEAYIESRVLLLLGLQYGENFRNLERGDFVDESSNDLTEFEFMCILEDSKLTAGFLWLRATIVLDINDI